MSDSSLLQHMDFSRGTVAVFGSLNADYTVTTDRLPSPGETINGGPLVILPGGKSSNQAAAAARLGAHVRVFGAVGDDANADFLDGRLRDAGVDTSALARVEGASGTTVITVDAQGENTIVYSPGANEKVDIDYVESVQDTLYEASVLGLCLESPLEVVTHVAQKAHERGMTVVVNNSPFMPQLPEALVKNCDLLLLNEHELMLMLDGQESSCADVKWDDVAERIRQRGFRRVIVTLGGDGSVVLDDGEVFRVQPVRVKTVDTTGCGDAFMGTVLAGLASGNTLLDSAKAASYVAAYAASGWGAQSSYGTLSQVLAAFVGDC